MSLLGTPLFIGCDMPIGAFLVPGFDSQDSKPHVDDDWPPPRPAPSQWVLLLGRTEPNGSNDAAGSEGHPFPAARNKTSWKPDANAFERRPE